MYTSSQLGEGELDIAAGTLTAEAESVKTRLLLSARDECARELSGTCFFFFVKSQHVTKEQSESEKESVCVVVF